LVFQVVRVPSIIILAVLPLALNFTVPPSGGISHLCSPLPLVFKTKVPPLVKL
jgi:hypothetical protein